MSARVLVVDDEADVEALFRQQFRREIRDGRFRMDFARSAAEALQLINAVVGETLILILSDINMPGTSGLNLLPKVRARAARRSGDYDYGVRRRRNKTKSSRRRR